MSQPWSSAGPATYSSPRLSNKDTRQRRGRARETSAASSRGNLRRSLTWDRGKELADHKRLTLATDLEVYFCRPPQSLAARH